MWFLFGILIGALVTWWFLTNRFRTQLADKDAELDGVRRQARQELEQERNAHDETRRRLSDAEGREASAVESAQSLENDLALGSAQAAPGDAAPTALFDRGSDRPPDEAPADAATSPDDLTKIKGIGAVLQGKLNRLGITTFQQIADLTPAEVERINTALDFPGRIEREQWVEQARAIVGRTPSS